MRVLMTADTVGGVWTYAIDLIRALPQHEFLLATMGARPTDTQRAAVQSLSNASLAESDWKLEWMDEPWDDVAEAGKWLLELEREFQPDVVHLNGYAHGTFPFTAPIVIVAHSCVLSWWRAVKGEEAPASWHRYRDEVAAGLRAANVVVFPTFEMLRELRGIYGGFGVSRVIWNGVSPASPTPNAPKSPFVLASGRLWDEAKNIALLDTVAPQLEWPVRAAGQSDFASGHFRSSHLELLGSLAPDAMRDAMEQAAIWAHPARYEPFGLAVLEAAQAGCALVLSDIPTLRELWDGAAFFASPHQPAEWVEALQKLIHDGAQRLVWAEKARARAQNYSLDRCGAAYALLYDELT